MLTRGAEHGGDREAGIDRSTRRGAVDEIEHAETRFEQTGANESAPEGTD